MATQVEPYSCSVFRKLSLLVEVITVRHRVEISKNVESERKRQGDIRGYQKFRDLILRYKSPPTPAYRNGAGTSAATASLPSRPVGSAGSARINFRPSPFYEIKQFASSIVQCPEAPNQNDRKNVPLFVNLTAEQVQQLKTPRYQLRLFCTTMEAHAASLSGRNPATVEFPLTCEARVNTHALSTNLRGSKKQAGRVPPPNLNKDNTLVLQEGRPNRIDLTYANAPKRHVLVAAICEVTTVETLVERLRSRQLQSKEEVLLKMRREAEDDDIEAGAATMSLKCPFSYMRIVTPCRGSHCSHVQCFDAYSFFSINEQTPSWSCPVCFKTIKPEDLMMDGYVDDILKRVPQDEDSVIIEPDGSWRTSDGKISSSGTAQATPAADVGTPLEDRLLSRDSEDVKPGHGKANGARRASPNEIVLLDSPSPPPTAGPSDIASTSAAAASTSSTTHQPALNGSAPPRVAALSAPRHERIEILSSSANTSARNSPAAGAGAGAGAGVVIDLTLDSDDEDSEPSVPTRPAPSNGAQHHPLPPRPASSSTLSTHNASSGGGGNRGAGFTGYSSNAAGTPNRSSGPFAAAMSRVEATPEDEQIRRPGKRPRTEAIPTPSDPRLVNGQRSGTSAAEQDRRTSLPASYLDVGVNGSRSNGSGQGAASNSGNGINTSSTRGTYREPTSARGADADDSGDNSWMDNANTSEHEQYINEEDWWN
ncbi:zinc finger protein [Pseudozyma hubeiensis SY62]|uniref:Zinc finger protein n=1 Tax=Pseudozyma hubeiensis (strain SY62) TaxID=1305764 RepID=R9P3D5_PSEHS|nr:zinc finger protein [Pseudozyma hubeiensis SY62]GAC95846.1 zinc finger protein [Pseudozyma hubeiensis SY62]